MKTTNIEVQDIVICIDKFDATASADGTTNLAVHTDTTRSKAAESEAAEVHIVPTPAQTPTKVAQTLFISNQPRINLKRKPSGGTGMISTLTKEDENYHPPSQRLITTAKEYADRIKANPQKQRTYANS